MFYFTVMPLGKIYNKKKNHKMVGQTGLFSHQTGRKKDTEFKTRGDLSRKSATGLCIIFLLSAHQKVWMDLYRVLPL